jgi:bacteriocin biosynthesis cyclodehydratase domain-containing protein
LQGLSLLGLHDSDVQALLQFSRQSGHRAQQVNVPAGRFDIPGFALSLSKHHLLVVAGGRPQPDLLASVNKDCLRIGTAWTQAALWGAEIALGPTVIPGVTACHHCYTRRYLANVEHEDVVQARDHFLRHNPRFEFQGQIAPLLQLSVAYLTAEVTRFLTGSRPPVALSRAVTYYPLSQSQAYDFVVPLEWCSVCHHHRVVVANESGPALAEVVQRFARLKEDAHAAG